MSHTTDIDLETGDILELGSLDAIVSFFDNLGYHTGERAPLTPEACTQEYESSENVEAWRR